MATVVVIYAFMNKPGSCNTDFYPLITPIVEENMRYGPSVFNMPAIAANGTSRPLFPDTSEKKTYLITSANLSKMQYYLDNQGFLDICRDEKDTNQLVPGEDMNPALVKIGSHEPTIIPFCAYSSVYGSKDFLVRVKDDSTFLISKESSYDPDIQGLNFTLSTRTLELPESKLFGDPGQVHNATFTMAKFYLGITATPLAKEGTREFSLDCREPNPEGSTQGRTAVGITVYVKVTK